MPFSTGTQSVWQVSWPSHGPVQSRLIYLTDKSKRESQLTLGSCENWAACGLEANSIHTVQE